MFINNRNSQCSHNIFNEIHSQEYTAQSSVRSSCWLGTI